MPVGPPSSPSGVFLLSEALSLEKAPEQVPSELPNVSETFLTCPVMFGAAPNITGAFNGQQNSWNSNGGYSTHVQGAFIDSKPYPGAINQGVLNLGAGFGFDASASNGTYNKSTTVQPASVRVLSCIKT